MKILCDLPPPAGTSNQLDVQNEWEEKQQQRNTVLHIYCSTETNKTRFYHPAKHVVTDACRFGKQLCSPRETYMYYFCTTECTAYSVFMKNLHLQGKNCPNIYLVVGGNIGCSLLPCYILLYRWKSERTSQCGTLCFSESFDPRQILL